MMNELGDTMLSAASAFTTAWLFTWLLKHALNSLGIVDVVGSRSLHKGTVSRGGGIAIVASIICGYCFVRYFVANPPEGVVSWLPLALGCGLLGLVDDIKHLPALARLMIQTALAYLLYLNLAPLLPPHPIIVLMPILIFVVWMINATNFMDGADGLLSSQTVLICAFAGWMAFLGQQTPLATFCLLLGSGTLGFLCWNWYPAKIFLGDVGSYFIGFNLAALALFFPLHGLPNTIVLILLTPLLADASFTLIRRVASGTAFWRPHRSHVYQLWVINGFSHAQVSTVFAGITAVIYGPMALLVSQSYVNGFLMLIVGWVVAAILWLILYFSARKRVELA